MQETLGARIAKMRKAKSLTQEGLAEQLGVSAQAVSKWENDQSCPDVMLLPRLASVLDTTTDVLLTGDAPAAARMVPEPMRKKIEEMTLRIYICTDGEEDVRISVPLMLLKVVIDSGMKPDVMLGTHGAALNGVDFEKLFMLVESGMIGTLMEMDVSDGTRIRIVVE